jgi:hypothetical protein
MEHMVYLGNRRNFGQAAAEIRARLPAQLDARSSTAGCAARHRLAHSDSLFRSRPNYTIPSRRYSLLGRKLSLVLTALLSAASGAAQAGTINALSPSLFDVSTAVAAAHDGDTISIPAGTASWTSTLNITKGITLMGKTTITGTPPNQTVNDATKIQDNTPRNQALPLIKVAITSSQSVRISGLTFLPGTTTTFSGASNGLSFSSASAATPPTIRLDHCHFSKLYQGTLIGMGGWVYGVIDHNLFETVNNCRLCLVRMPNYGGPRLYNGNGAWADYPWYGTDKFVFFEDNMISGGGPNPNNATIDSDYGGRFVMRHNYLRNSSNPSTHGTEGGAYRGVRAVEFYNNTIEWTLAGTNSGQRSGTSLWHDNTYIGNKPPVHTQLANYRETPARSQPIWGPADGTSLWDQNDTEGNGTWVEGHAPHVFASGAASFPSDISGGTGTIVDSSTPTSWTTNQWASYSIKSTSSTSASYNVGSFIYGNAPTAHSIAYNYYTSSDTPKHLTFATGDKYEIHRILRMMDQNGSGKGDVIVGTGTNNSIPVMQSTGKPGWIHQVREPCYSWNNVHTPTNTALGYGTPTAQPTTKENLDYFNLGKGLPANTAPSQVSSYYTAAVNGVAYTGTFTYPHPLVSGSSPSPTPTPTPNSTLNPPTNLRVVP